PVDVLKNHEDGPLGRRAVKLVEQRREGHLPPLLGCDPDGGISFVAVEREKIGDERQIPRGIFHGRLEQGLKLVEPCFCVTVLREVGSPLELFDKRVERTGGLMRRAEITKARARLALEPGQQAFGNAGLANPGLAREQYDPTLAVLRLVPTTQQQVHLLLPANQRRQRARPPRLEAADAGSLSPHLPGGPRRQQSVELVVRERATVDHPANKAPRAGRNDDRAGCCDGLQLRCQVWRIADCDRLARLTGRWPLIKDS